MCVHKIKRKLVQQKQRETAFTTTVRMALSGRYAVRNRRIGSFSKDDGDGNKNGKNAIGDISKTTTLAVPHTFFVHFSLPSLRGRRENSRFT